MLLRPLAGADEPQVRAAQAELLADGFNFLLDERDGESWPAYVDRVRRWPDADGLAPHHVPSTFLVAELDGRARETSFLPLGSLSGRPRGASMGP